MQWILLCPSPFRLCCSLLNTFYKNTLKYIIWFQSRILRTKQLSVSFSFSESDKALNVCVMYAYILYVYEQRERVKTSAGLKCTAFHKMCCTTKGKRSIIPQQCRFVALRWQLLVILTVIFIATYLRPMFPLHTYRWTQMHRFLLDTNAPGR
jgi:hypothetical protein